MLVLTREAKGWTQRDLAMKSGLSQAAISKIESGAIDVSGERLRNLAQVLDCPPSLLCRPTPRVDTANTCLHHRRRQSKLSASATRRVEGVAHLTRVTVEGIFDGLNMQLATDICSDYDPRTPATGRPQIEVSDLSEPNADAISPSERAASPASSPDTAASNASTSDLDSAPFDLRRADTAARRLREYWNLEGPITNVVGTLERHGILVVYRNLGSRAQDGVSSWPADLTHPPIIVINQDLPPDRVRFTVVHELGHLLLHRVPTDEAEREANRFAAEFLVPAAAIKPELEGLTTRDFARLARLKPIWGVSIGMLIQRARDTETISDRQFREFRVRLTRLGWDANEPGSLPEERPTLLSKAITIGRENLGLSTEELADMAFMTPASFRRHYVGAGDQIRAPRQVLNLAAPDGASPSGDASDNGGL